MVKKLVITNREDFKLYIKNNKFVVIKASATWCGPCKKINSELIKIIDSLSNSISVVFLDIDDGRDLSSYLKIPGVPAFLFYIDGAPDICLVGSDLLKINKFFKGVTDKVIENS